MKNLIISLIMIGTSLYANEKTITVNEILKYDRHLLNDCRENEKSCDKYLNSFKRLGIKKTVKEIEGGNLGSVLGLCNAFNTRPYCNKKLSAE